MLQSDRVDKLEPKDRLTCNRFGDEFVSSLNERDTPDLVKIMASKRVDGPRNDWSRNKI